MRGLNWLSGVNLVSLALGLAVLVAAGALVAVLTRR